MKSKSDKNQSKLPWWVELLFVQIGLPDSWLSKYLKKKKKAADFIHENSTCDLLWASPRMHYDVITAQKSGCDIITMTNSMYKKLSLLNKTPEEYSLETVKMFYEDAVSSGFKI